MFFIMRRAEEKEKSKDSRYSESFITGVVALVFLIIGYQTAVFLHHASVTRIAAGRDEPDTVFVYAAATSCCRDDAASGNSGILRKEASHSERVKAVRERLPVRKVETFRFDPNEVSISDLCRLGFSPKQAKSIDNYRKSGGRFRRKADFADSFVVSDSVFRRLEPYIDIPLVDLNVADSSALDELPGIGGWFASKIIEHRKALGGYSYKEQLMDIYRFDTEKYEALKDLVTVSAQNMTPYPLWTLPADSLQRHPYIRNRETAASIVLYRENNPVSLWTMENLCAAGIFSPDDALKISACAIIPPP